MMTEKPTVVLTGENGNVFNLLAICVRGLEQAGLREESKELTEKIWACESYNEALNLMGEYVTIH